MKRFSMLFTVLLLSLFFTGCGEAAPSIDYSEIPTNAVQNMKSGATVSLGMSQSEVEAILGSIDKNAKGWYAYKSGLFLQYEGDTLARIALQGSGIWTGKYGFTPGGPSEEIWRLYGEVTPVDKTVGEWTAPSLVYMFNSEGLSVESKEDGTYTVCFMLTEELDQIDTIIISSGV